MFRTAAGRSPSTRNCRTGSGIWRRARASRSPSPLRSEPTRASRILTDTQTDPPVPARQGQAWSDEEDRRLYDSFLAGQPINRMASVHQRSAGAIRARLRRLGLIDENGEVVEPPPPFAVPERRRSRAMEGQGAAESKQAM